MLPEGWRECRLGDLFENRKERGRDGLPTLSVTMTDGLVDREDLDRKQDSALTPEEHLLVKPGDIAYNTMRMWQGAFGLAEYAGIVSPAYVVLKSTQEVDPAYVAHLFRAPRMLYQFWAYSYGLTEDRLRLYFNDFSAIKAKIPSKDVQCRFAEILSTWDRAIVLTERLADNAEIQRNLLAERLIPTIEGDRAVPSGFLTVRLGDIIGEIESGVSVNGMERSAKEGELGVLKISAVTSGVFIPSQNKLIRPDEAQRAKISPCSDRIIVSRSNTAELVGASAYVDRDYPCLFLPDKLWQLQPVSSDIHMQWISIWLSMKSTRLKLSSFATGSSGSMKNISQDQLLSMQLALPSYKQQRRIAEEISYWSQASSNFRKQAKALTAEKRALMAGLLTGQRHVRLPEAKVTP